MTTKEFRVHALETLKTKPGLTRMEWFKACDVYKGLWHTFKFEVAPVLIRAGRVKVEPNLNDRGLDLFSPVGE